MFTILVQKSNSMTIKSMIFDITASTLHDNYTNAESDFHFYSHDKIWSYCHIITSLNSFFNLASSPPPPQSCILIRCTWPQGIIVSELSRHLLQTHSTDWVTVRATDTEFHRQSQWICIAKKKLWSKSHHDLFLCKSCSACNVTRKKRYLFTVICNHGMLSLLQWQTLQLVPSACIQLRITFQWSHCGRNCQASASDSHRRWVIVHRKCTVIWNCIPVIFVATFQSFQFCQTFENNLYTVKSLI